MRMSPILTGPITLRVSILPLSRPSTTLAFTRKTPLAPTRPIILMTSAGEASCIISRYLNANLTIRGISQKAQLFGILEILWISESQRDFVSLKISEKFHFFKDNIESKIPCVRTNLRFILHLRMISAQNQFIRGIPLFENSGYYLWYSGIK